MITEKINWEQYRVMLFTRISKLVENSNCSTYTVLGYKYLATKLILHYTDRDRVFLFEYNPIDENHTNTDLGKQFSETSYCTEEFSTEDLKKSTSRFREDFNRD